MIKHIIVTTLTFDSILLPKMQYHKNKAAIIFGSSSRLQLALQKAVQADVDKLSVIIPISLFLPSS